MRRGAAGCVIMHRRGCWRLLLIAPRCRHLNEQVARDILVFDAWYGLASFIGCGDDGEDNDAEPFVVAWVRSGAPGYHSMRVAALTFVFNEAVNLPIWIKYYGSNFGERNLYVVDRESTDD